MFYTGRRPMGRLFYWIVAGFLTGTNPFAATSPVPQSPTLTTITDTVYRADGNPAQGNLIIMWPAFVTASGTVVVAGNTNVTLGANGALSVALAPNAGASPAGLYYTVVYQLGPGEVRTEYWMVPTTSPVNLAAVRTTPGSGIAGQPVSMQYVNTALATKADNSGVVHLSGSETISGSKVFSVAPSVPSPLATGDVANKSYVDTAVANVGAGNFLPTAGGTLTGPLTLSGSPTAPLQATTKQYVDNASAAKADLITGLVPAGELGAGTANAGTCLYGNGTWGACGSGGGNVFTTPAGTQAISEPVGAVFTANRMGQKRMADQFNWKQTPTTPATLVAGPVTVTLSPCPQGFLNTINGSNSNHWIYVDSAVGDLQQPGEPVLITAENCPAGAASGTIGFSAAYAHGAGYAVESGTGGIKEASVDANQVRYDTVRGNNTWIEVTPTATTKIKAPLYWQTSFGRLMGASLLECSVNMSCLNIGDTNSSGFAHGNSNLYVANIFDGFWMRSDASLTFWDVAPSLPATITAGGSSATLTMPTCPAGFWPLIPNQILWLNGTSGGLVTTAFEATAPGPGEFVRVTGGSCTPGATNGTITIVPATPGISALSAHGAGYTLSNGATALIEDNSQGTVIRNITVNGFVGNVGYGFAIQNDNNQSEEVSNVNMFGGTPRCDNDFCGATLFGPGPNSINAGITHLHGGSQGTCAEWYDGNDLLIGPTVCQGFANFALFMSTKRGGSLQRASVHSVHRERGNLSNSLGPSLGAADMIVQGYNVAVDGNGDGLNAFPVFQVVGAPGGQLQLYYLSVVDVTDGTKTVPIPIGQANVNNPNANSVTVKWVTADVLSGKTVNFELYRFAPSYGTPGQVPYPGVCDGLNGNGTCLVAGNIDPATVCDIHGACVFTDNVATPGAATPYNGTDGTGIGGYFPVNSFSPGGVVLSGGATYQGEPACLVATGTGWLNTVAAVFDNASTPSGCMPSGGSFNAVLSSFPNNGGVYSQFGMLFPDRNKTNDGGHWTGLKGRVNFIGGGSYPRDVATWSDSNPAKTMGSKLEYGTGVAGTTYGTVNRPQWDAADVATGVENGGTGLYERVPGNGVFDWYLGALPNNPGGTSSNWTEELSSSGHTINVPLTVNGNLTVTGTCTGCGGGGSVSWPLAAPQGTLSAPSYTFQTNPDVGLYVAASPVTFSITSAVRSGGMSTITTGGTFNYSVGQTVLVAGVSDTSFNGTFVLNSTTGTTVTYAQALGNSTSSGGTIAIYTVGLAGHDVRFNRLQSSSANVAQTGSLELGPSDPIRARDAANSIDVTLLKKWTGAGESRRAQLGDVWGAAALGPIEAPNFVADAASGTPPFTVSSSTIVANLNANYLNGAAAATLGTANAIPIAGSNGKLDLSWLPAGGGSGTVNNAPALQLAMYLGTGTAVSGDSALTDSGTTLNYAGSGGIAASSGTFAGNVTVNGQLLVAGPWVVSSPIPGTAMGAASAGTSALGISNDGNFYVSANGATPQKIATSASSSYFTNLFQEDANNLGAYNGTTSQGLNIYGTRTDASNFERLRLGYDSTNNYFTMIADYAGTGVHRGLGFNVNGSLRWVIDALNTFKPWSDNLQDVGSASLRVRNGYFGTGLITPSLTLNGTALSGVIGTPSGNLITAGTVSGSGQPLCTDGTGSLTITTVGCPPGTGTLGGGGTTPQFAYWTNTNGLGAAPLSVTNANTVEQYNGTNVQTFNVYGTYTNASNYERASLAYVSGDGYFELQTQQAGTGAQRGVCFGVNNSCKWAVDTTTAFKPFNDNTRDIGTSSLRVRDFYLGRNLVMSGTATTYNGKATAGTGLSPVYGTVSVTGQTATIASTSLCATSICGAGQYVLNYYLDATVACTTAGSAAASLTIGWTDETNAKTLQVPLNGTGISGGNSLALGATANFGSGSVTIWSAGGANITYSTTYAGCTTGTGTYALRMAVRQLQ